MSEHHCCFEGIERKLDNINNLLEKFLMTIEEYMAKIDEVTTQDATNLKGIFDALKAQNGTLTPAQEAHAADTFAHLEDLGKDPTVAPAPVPPAV